MIRSVIERIGNTRAIRTNSGQHLFKKSNLGIMEASIIKLQDNDPPEMEQQTITSNVTPMYTSF